VVADGKGSDHTSGIQITDVGIFFDLENDSSRIKRIFKTLHKVFSAAKEIDADVYHFHDPELMIIGYLLKRQGKKVIYDIHEDIPKQVYNKPYISKPLMPVVAFFLKRVENFFSKRFDYLITATPSITARFEKINEKSTTVRNYPITGEFENPTEWEERSESICYVGVITENRGIRNIIKALEHTDATLHLAGLFYPATLKNEMMKLPGWKKVVYHGVVGRTEIREILFNSKIGIVTLMPIINYLDSLPVKMFEYMMAGLPVIASNFPLWEKIITSEQNGMVVNPTNHLELADAINYLLKNQKVSILHAKNGLNAVKKKYNWTIEEQSLFEVYKKLEN